MSASAAAPSPFTNLFAGLFDDAAIFPPGNLPMHEAVPAHHQHLAAAYQHVVGSLVVAARDLQTLSAVRSSRPGTPLDITLVAPLEQVAPASAVVAAMPDVRCVSVEIVLPDGLLARDLRPALDEALGSRPPAAVYVEVPRDQRRPAVVSALAGTPFGAKLRTGGVRSDLYPGEVELARAILASVRAGVPFKATAGMHHALRNTDPATGFEQHGFLNVLAATGDVLDGADETHVVDVLADRDASNVCARVRALEPQVREWFRSLGTCSVAEPVADLVELGLIDLEQREAACPG